MGNRRRSGAGEKLLSSLEQVHRRTQHVGTQCRFCEAEAASYPDSAFTPSRAAANAVFADKTTFYTALHQWCLVSVQSLQAIGEQHMQVTGL